MRPLIISVAAGVPTRIPSAAAVYDRRNPFAGPSLAVTDRRYKTPQPMRSPYNYSFVIFWELNFAAAISHSALIRTLHGCSAIPFGSFVAISSSLTDLFPASVHGS